MLLMVNEPPEPAVATNDPDPLNPPPDPTAVKLKVAA
jgi:hypothetical protein